MRGERVFLFFRFSLVLFKGFCLVYLQNTGHLVVYVLFEGLVDGLSGLLVELRLGMGLSVCFVLLDWFMYLLLSMVTFCIVIIHLAINIGLALVQGVIFFNIDIGVVNLALN